ncbi:MAG: ABC transporter permease [Tissierellia bacterium]|nr:ABC transporter permease [Tissierellia bacterium]
MMEIFNILEIIITSTLRMSVPLILASTGATFSMRSGVSDLGCEGMMIGGAFFGVLGSYIFDNAWIGLLFAALFGMLFALQHAVLHVTFKVNATLSGMSVNLLSAATATLLLQIIWGRHGNSPRVSAFSKIQADWLKKLPVIGEMLAEQNILFYLSLVIVILAWIYMFKTNSGLRLRMVGENPQAANTVGINVVAYKYFGVLMCGLLCGLGGAYLSLGQLNIFVDGMTGGRGYIAIVINAFGGFSPIGSLLGSLFFGFFESLQTIFQGKLIPSNIVRMMPYILTIIVLSIGIRSSKAPAGVGKYHDE